MFCITFVSSSSNTCRFTSKNTKKMLTEKENNTNHVKTPTEKVETPNRLKAISQRFPTMKPMFKQFFRDNGIGDYTFDNIASGRQKLVALHDKIIDRMVAYFNITE